MDGGLPRNSIQTTLWLSCPIFRYYSRLRRDFPSSLDRLPPCVALQSRFSCALDLHPSPWLSIKGSTSASAVTTHLPIYSDWTFDRIILERHIYSSHGRLKGTHVSARARQRKATEANVISLSGCKNGQTSADTFSGGVAVGAASYAFIEVVEEHPRAPYRELLHRTRSILHPKFSQKPQLSSSHPINTSLTFIM
ncbi:hypothetical protein C8J57DRAFT_534132 [Mycena rebaudengoi]|nr:hypothetical protein C8J57DRAFT_534132 [Mycena rebaudengoi]